MHQPTKANSLYVETYMEINIFLIVSHTTVYLLGMYENIYST